MCLCYFYFKNTHTFKKELESPPMSKGPLGALPAWHRSTQKAASAAWPGLRALHHLPHALLSIRSHTEPPATSLYNPFHTKHRARAPRTRTGSWPQEANSAEQETEAGAAETACGQCCKGGGTHRGTHGRGSLGESGKASVRWHLSGP